MLTALPVLGAVVAIQHRALILSQVEVYMSPGLDSQQEMGSLILIETTTKTNTPLIH